MARISLLLLLLAGCRHYQVRELGPGAPGTFAALNGKGTVAATQIGADGKSHMFGFFNQAGQAQAYQVDNAGFRLENTVAAGVSGAGFSAGTAGGAATNGKLRGIVLSGPDGVIHQDGNPAGLPAILPLLENTEFCEARGMNALVSIVGSCTSVDRRFTMATLWPGWSGAAAQAIGTGVASDNSVAVAINSSGNVAGRASPAQNSSFAWFRGSNGQVQTIDAAGSDGTLQVAGLSDGNIVIGSGKDQTGNVRGWAWRQSNGSFTYLPQGNFGAVALPFGVNSAGVVVGTCGTRACLWANLTGSGSDLTFADPVDLNANLDRGDVRLSIASQINDSGVILAWGATTADPLTQRLFLLTPP